MSEVENSKLADLAEALDGATDEEIAAFAGAALERIAAGGRLPRAVFNPIRERVRMSTVEVVAFRRGTDGREVLIGQRTANPEDWWAGQLNLPGSVILPNEQLVTHDLVMSNGRPVDLGDVTVSRDLASPTDRILAEEFQGSVRRTGPAIELERLWVQAGRSAENEVWVLTEVELAPGHEGVWDGGFYDTQEVINNRPDKLVVGHEYFIDLGYQALRAF